MALVAFAVAFGFAQWWDGVVSPPFRPQYQAVFLTNGQTYFGRYYDRIGAYVKIEDPYYIQQVAGVDPEKPGEQKLVRRGGELHAPQRKMLIPRDAILFVEDLGDGSPIAQFMTQDRDK